MTLKRSFDIVAASAGLVLGAAPILVTAFAMAVANKDQPLFLQKRTGLKGKPFTIYKIRTMSRATDDSGALLPDEQRTTKLGKFVRKSRLDELPQLFNIIKGDMSRVGPRPVLEHISLAKDVFRHNVRLGLTGLAQINGLNNLSTEEALAFDHKYIREKSFWKDMAIILQTPCALIKNRHIPHYLFEAQESARTAPHEPEQS